MDATESSFDGVFTALITPFAAGGESVDFARLETNVAAQAIAGVAGVVPCGTTGETPTLREDEYRRVVERVVEAAAPAGLAVIAGAGSNSTEHAVELHRFVESAGASAALHVTPYYNKPRPEGLYRHYMAIADSCDLPIVLYNIPGRTAVALSIDTIERIAAHPNVRVIKEASGSLEIASRIVARTDLVLLSGDDPMTLPLATLGARGVVSVLSNLVPDRVAALCHAFLAGDWEKARSINDPLLALARALLTLDTNPVPLKTALALLGRDTGDVRLPLCPPGPGVVEQLQQALDAAGVGEVEAVEVSRVTTPAVDHGALPYKIAVLCYLYDSEGRVLLLHRRKSPNAGMYSPIGGKLEVAIGESPHACAVREIEEEAGVRLADEAVRLTGIVAETAYEGETHWLIFLFEIMRPIEHGEIATMSIGEGDLEWVGRDDVLNLEIPLTDRQIMWPLVQEHRGGFFMVHIDCSVEPMRWVVQESERRADDVAGRL